MKTPHIAQSSSERGIALIVVLLLMAVLSGLATGFAMTGNVEVQMGTNEVYYAGARAAAEAGLNRAIVEIINNTDTNFLNGHDGNIASTADNGKLTWLLGGVAGPYALDAAGEYSYDIEILDDDDDALYETPLSDDQVATMHENPQDPLVNLNDRLILRAIGRGPNGTVVRIARVLETVDTTLITVTNTPSTANPAIVVNGDLEMNGNITIQGTSGNPQFGSVHANGDLHKTGTSGTVTGDATAHGEYSTAGGFTPGGAAGGGRPTITVPDIQAITYIGQADCKLTSTGAVQTKNSSGVWSNCTTAPCKGTGWTYSSGTWSTDKNPSDGTYYVEGNVDIGPTSGTANKAVSVLATGNINIHGNAKLTPENDAKIQFVCNGDLKIDNGSDLDPPVDIDGQILVRGQLDSGGNMEFQGRVMVQDVAGAGSLVDNNKLHGNVKFTYGGTLGAIDTTTTTTTTGPTTYVNNVSGWMEQ